MKLFENLNKCIVSVFISMQWLNLYISKVEGMWSFHHKNVKAIPFLIIKRDQIFSGKC